MIKRIINNLGEYICYCTTGRTKVPLLTLSSRSSSCRLSWSASQVSAGVHQHCSVRKKSTDKINTKTFKVKGKFWENKHLHQRKFVGMAANAHEIKETLYHGNQVIWLLYVECPELVCYHTTWKNRPYGAVSPSAGWLLRGPYFCDYCMNWVCLSSVCEMELCMNNKYSCESSCHHPSLYRCMSKSGKVWKLSFNADVTQHVRIIYVTPAIYWEFAWELHSELCWFLSSNDSTDSLHIWILPYKNCNVDEVID